MEEKKIINVDENLLGTIKKIDYINYLSKTIDDMKDRIEKLENIKSNGSVFQNPYTKDKDLNKKETNDRIYSLEQYVHRYIYEVGRSNRQTYIGFSIVSILILIGQIASLFFKG